MRLCFSANSNQEAIEKPSSVARPRRIMAAGKPKKKSQGGFSLLKLPLLFNIKMHSKSQGGSFQLIRLSAIIPAPECSKVISQPSMTAFAFNATLMKLCDLQTDAIGLCMYPGDRSKKRKGHSSD